ncbi:polysaccharide/polyol phosphate ABC transporter, ATP-binding protein [Campylobacter showae]|uniref:ABC transporter, ATP-binding protein n=1 Tax=Campylobacter showae RM3277 TaxID=553219 RepID=C6RGX7_9BACT|nr:ABC transporter ATP-binding protein [Campylobacter showae]EET79333.1 ABC transporter, ATP-binding protein [Campylobacter showae RM3277]QCD49738.1 polysaccharide/polyol phosphate ABC transporter, ATP-binding protein [Campylobacter showae]
MILSVQNICKTYLDYESNFKRFASWFSKNKEEKNVKTVLKDVSFDVGAGEVVGLIGQNGAGKSTLLKIISHTLKPSSGRVTSGAKISSILELGMGFHGDLTGRQNAYQSCSLMGYSKEQIDEIIAYIEDFAEIGEYFDYPVRIYSSGMQMRLAFSVVTANRPDILIIDEALSVGDVYFQHKSFDKIKEFKSLGTTLIIVSHDSGAIKSICDRVILLEKGQILKDGEPEAVLDYYNALISKKQDVQISQVALENGKIATISGNKKACIKNVEILDAAGKKIQNLEVGKKIKLKVTVQANENLLSLVLGYQIKNRFSQVVYGTNTYHLKQALKNLKKGEEYDFSFEFDANLGVGSFSVTLALHDSDNHLQNNYEWRDNAIIFNVVNFSKPDFVGLAYLEPSLEIKRING